MTSTLSPSVWFFFSLVPFFLLCALILIVYLRRSRLRLPPGPPGIPAISHLHLLGTEIHRSLWELSKRYGPLMFLRFGSVPVIIASTPATARLILQKHDHIFSCRSPTAVAMHITECKDLLFSQPGPYFKLIRQLSFSELFGSKRLQSFRCLISQEIRHLLCEVADCSDKVSVRERLYETSFSIISRMTVGKHAKDILSHSPTGPSYSLLAVIVEILDLVGVSNIGDYIPLLAWMDLQGCVRRSKGTFAEVNGYIWRDHQ
ncbi:hypothetical protein KP509_16G057200 [Ceratopteris richardii]|uniref:Cytochrome P450 n=1 Tax=Ceratopteris richardii TaxID=49495 RepID=A0A8T2T3A4_CERRI|nr:hypothetical protein KP509_16G057200 [Ceratopteris richardii]